MLYVINGFTITRLIDIRISVQLFLDVFKPWGNVVKGRAFDPESPGGKCSRSTRSSLKVLARSTR